MRRRAFLASLPWSAVVLTVLTSSLAPDRAAAQGGPVFDHLKCYKLKLPKQKAISYVLDLVPEQTNFQLEQGCKLADKPRYLCVDVQKINVQPAPPLVVPGPKTQDYLCYKIKCPPTVEVPVTITDQFGVHQVTAKKKGDLLCVPAFKQGFPTATPVETRTPTPVASETPIPIETSTPMATPTMVPPPCDLDAANGQCAGVCPVPTEKCLFIAAVAICDCVPMEQMCMDDGAGLCNGLCPNPSERCLPMADGTCDCQPVKCGLDQGSGTCFGPCPPGQACVFDGVICDCSPDYCGQMSPNGQCAGPCPDPLHQCQPIAGTCGCAP